MVRSPRQFLLWFVLIFLTFDTDACEAMSASSKMAQDADDAMSESSWTALAKGKERDWWSIDLEGDMEKLEVVGPWSGTEGGSVDPKRQMGHEEKGKGTERRLKQEKMEWMTQYLKKRVLKSKVRKEK